MADQTNSADVKQHRNLINHNKINKNKNKEINNNNKLFSTDELTLLL